MPAASASLASVLDSLLSAYGPRGWWPLPSLADAIGRDGSGYALGPSLPVGPGLEAAALRFEIAVGAVLAQNTSWTGAERAVAALAARAATEGLALSPELLNNLSGEELEELLRPAGTFRIKARYLRSLAEAWPALDSGTPSREAFLAVPGIGDETADCILLYAYGVPVFVADAYARRVMARLGIIEPSLGYEATRSAAEAALPSDAPFLAEAHALIVEHAKLKCRSKPRCGDCPLTSRCEYYSNNRVPCYGADS